MVHGAPDNYNVKPMSSVYRLNDMAELAVRLGGLSSIDRLGEVLDYEDFTESLGKGTVVLSGTGAIAEISGDKFRSAGYSLKMIGGSNSGQSAYYGIHLPYPVLSKFGFESWFYIDSNVKNIQLHFSHYNGSKERLYWIMFDVDNERLRYYDQDGNWQNIVTPVNFLSTNQPFLACKYIMDLNNNKFMRLRLLGNTYDLSDFLPYSSNDTTVPSIIMSVIIYSMPGENGIIYLDNMILTQNEF